MRVVLIVLDLFLSLTAFTGGIGLLTGVAAPPVEQLVCFGLGLLILVLALLQWIVQRRAPAVG